jgi:hypothetical protein
MRTVLLLLAIATSAQAATEYRVSFEETRRPIQPGSGTMTFIVDGPNWCQRQNGATKAFSTDGKTIIMLDHQLKTWWVSESKALFAGARPVQSLPMITHVKVRELRVTASDESSDERVAGLPVHKYSVIATYQLAGEMQGMPITTKQGITLFLWTNDSLHPATIVPLIDLTTGMAEVDAALAPKLAAIPGFALKTQLVATRAFAGGVPTVAMDTFTIDEIRTVTVPPHAFERPHDYINQAPILTAPGVSR